MFPRDQEKKSKRLIRDWEGPQVCLKISHRQTTQEGVEHTAEYGRQTNDVNTQEDRQPWQELIDFLEGLAAVESIADEPSDYAPVRTAFEGMICSASAKCGLGNGMYPTTPPPEQDEICTPPRPLS
jgi:hypothetical protein